MLNWVSDTVKYAVAWSFYCLEGDCHKNYDNSFIRPGKGIDKPYLENLLVNANDVFKNDKTTTVVQIGTSQKPLILKRYNARNAQHKFSRALRRSRARCCWDMSYRFAKAGLNVAAPYLMFEQRFGCVRMDTYFMNEKLHGQELLEALPKMSESQQQLVLDKMSEAFKKMKIAKISHGDLKATNLMWVNGELFFIDLDGARQHKFYWTWKRSHTKDRKRFMKNWKDIPELLSLFKDL